MPALSDTLMRIMLHSFYNVYQMATKCKYKHVGVLNF